jgi:hypothetical protein
LADVLEFLNDRFDLTVRVDEAAFKKAGRERVPEKPVSLPRMAGVTVTFALEVAAQQVGGTVREEAGRVLVVPGKRDVATLLRPAADEFNKKLARDVTLEKAVAGAMWDDVIEHFGDRYELNVVVCEWLFPAAARPNAPPAAAPPAVPAAPVRQGFRKAVRHWSVLGKIPCSLPAGTKSLRRWLDEVAAQAGARVEVRDNVILIVPASGNRS